MELSTVTLLCFLGLTLGAGAAVMVVRDLVASPGGTRLGGKSLRRVPSVFDEAPARSFTGRLDQAFDRLVLESGNDATPQAVFLLLIACGLLVGGLCYSYWGEPLAGIAGMGLGMIAPLGVLMVQRARRTRQIREQLPHVLDLLARAVRAGKSLDQAIALVGNEAGGVLGREFTRCARQLEMGRALPAVMKSLASRVRLVELRIFATTLGVYRRTGGSLADTLERMSGVIRDRLSAYRQMRAATGAGRASTLLIATICPIAYVIMFLWQPEHVRLLYEDPLGRTMLIVAVLLEIVGVLWAVALLRQE